MNTEPLHASRTRQIDFAAHLASRYRSTGPQARRLMRLAGAYRRQLERDGYAAATLLAEIAAAVPLGSVVGLTSTVHIGGVEVP